MASEEENAFFAAQQVAQQKLLAEYAAADARDGIIDGNTDGDDYDPSPTYTKDSFVNKPPAEPTSHSAKDSSAPNHDPKAASQTPEPRATRAPGTRVIGGFVFSDSDEEETEDAEDAEDAEDETKDEDVYGSADGTEPSGPHNQRSLNSAESPQVSIHDGVQVSSRADDGLNGPSAFSPISALPNAGVPDDSDAVPAQPLQVSAMNPAHEASDVVGPALVGPKARLAHDTIGILEDRIAEDPRGDIDAWLLLLGELRSRNKKDETRRVYERFLTVFPLCAEQWASYAAWENENNHLFELEQIFGKSLLKVPSVQLWQIYLTYVRRRNNMTTGDTTKAYKIISDSFNFALDNVGMDKDSGPIWQEFINFVKTGPGFVGGTSWQDTQKMDALRAAYQKAIAVPTSALAPLWKEYDGFEMSLSKINGRKFLQERSPAYVTARSCFTQLQNMTVDLERTTLPRLPPAPGSVSEHEGHVQVELWKKWIEWEKDDNLVLKDDDPAAYRKRILFIYKQALMALQFWPEIWYGAAEFCFEAGIPKEGLDFLKGGIAANPESSLLTFKLADHIELTTSNDDGNDPGAKRRMEKVRGPYDKCLEALYELVNKAKSKEKLDVSRIEERNRDLLGNVQRNNEPDEEDDEDPIEKEARRTLVRAQIDAINQDVGVTVALLQKTISYVWIALIRAARRIQGKGRPGEKSGGFRAIFGDARKRGKITSDVYVENALIEYHCYEDAIGTKIFERGMKLFPEDETFALEYLKHLIAINDITNARAVFETTVGKLTANPSTAGRAKPIFAFLHEYESHFGELSQVAKLEKRMADLFPDDATNTDLFSQRYSARNFDPTTVRLIVSPSQTKSLPHIHRSIETEMALRDSPAPRVSDTGATNSPKRPFPADEFDDNQPRKFARGESPLKGAAGRRINQQQRTGGSNGNINFQPTPLSNVQVPPPPPLPGQLAVLLSVLPRSSFYEFRRFDAGKMVDLLRNVRLPGPTNPQGPLQSQPGQGWGSYQQPAQQQQQQQPNMMVGAPSGNYRY